MIVMPEATPLLKVSATKALGAEVVLCGDNYDAAFERALQIAKRAGFGVYSPFCR